MRNFIILYLLITSCNHQSTNSKIDRYLPNDAELSEIVRKVIEIDSLDRSEGNCLYVEFLKHTNKYAFSTKNDKLEQARPSSIKYFGTIKGIFQYFETFIGLNLNLNDSIFLVQQIYTSDSRIMDSSYLPNLELINTEELKSVLVDYHTLYMFYTPLFTSDKNFVIVSYDILEKIGNGGTHSGYGLIVILQRIDGKWRKIHTNGSWVS